MALLRDAIQEDTRCDYTAETRPSSLSSDVSTDAHNSFMQQFHAVTLQSNTCVKNLCKKRGKLN